MSAGWHTVHVRVNDAATGQPTPVRIRVTGPDGEYLAPFGRLVDIPTGTSEAVGGNLEYRGTQYAYIDGTCEMRLPAGRIQVEIHKGPEYRPVHEEVQLSAGKLALRFTIERWINLREQGWYSGEGRAHFLTPHAALLEAAAEDLAVVNLLADDRSPASLLNILAFSGQKPALEMPGHQVVVNTLNRHPVLGQLALLNCHRPVHPLGFGGPDSLDDWTLADWCDQCHRKHGLVVWCEVNLGSRATGADDRVSEALADLILHKVDALEIADLGASYLKGRIYPLWNAGFRVPLMGASGKASNAAPLGRVRTYAHLAAEKSFSYKAWIEAVRAGRNFATNGPLLLLNVDGNAPGTIIEIGEPRMIPVHAEARGSLPLGRLEIVVNGQVVATVSASSSMAQLTIDTEAGLQQGGWLAARYSADDLAAHTSPVYVAIKNQKAWIDSASAQHLLGILDTSLRWVQTRGRFATDRQREQHEAIFQEARAVLLARANSQPNP